MTELELRKKLISTATAYLGCKESDGSHRKIIDIYNAHKPLAVGYKVTYTDAWCSTFVSAMSILCGFTKILPTECGCGRHIDLFKKLDSWVESDTYVPTMGDVIFYNWNDSGVGECTTGASHVGIVTACNGKNITVIEGNISNAVGYRNLSVGGRYIRGYGVPKYALLTDVPETSTGVKYSVKVGDFDSKADAEAVQAKLRNEGYAAIIVSNGKEEEPGYSLKQFIMDVQAACGAAVDGVAGAETLSKTVTLSAAINARHKAVKPVQMRLMALGYTEVGEADGVAGAKFTSAVKRYQRENGCTADGEISAKDKTWKKLLGIA